MTLVGSPSVSAEVDSTPSQGKVREGKRHHAYSLLYGLGVEQNIPYGLELMEKEAMAGLAPASCLLGFYYIYGSFGLDNPAKGIEWLQRSAWDGSAAAIGILSVCYMPGYGVEQDLDKTFLLAKLASGKGEAWLKRASACGNKMADFALEAINLARSTKAVPESELGSLSAEECYAQAVYRLYREGNRDSAAPFLQRAVDLGYGAAVALQAGEQMSPNLPETERKALLDRLSSAAEAGCAHAVLLLSTSYGGAGGGVDSEEFHKWTFRSAELGYGAAAYVVGSWYFNAVNTLKPDLEKALLWLRKAADTGNPEAKANVEMVEKMLRLKSGQDDAP